jgi:hypothetical protein
MTIETAEALNPGHEVAPLAVAVPEVGTIEPAGVEGDEAASFAAELENMKQTASDLQEQGLLTAEEAAEQHEQVEQTRRRYQDLAPEERRAVNRALRDRGRRLLEGQVSGAPVIQEVVTLNHSRLSPVLVTWWAFLNRMSVNIGRFGRNAFDGQKQADTIQKWFEDQQKKLGEYVQEQLDVARAFTTEAERLIVERGRKPLRPTVTRPSLVIEVEAFTPYSYDLLQNIKDFDEVMGYFDFMVFNRVRDQSDIDDEVHRFLNKLRPVGLRGLNTHRKLMLTIQNL